MNQNLIRQIKDIQSQADNIIRNKTILEDLDYFSQYNEELKTYLKKEVKDEFILKYIHEIPSLNEENLEKGGFWYKFATLILVGWIARGVVGNHFKEKNTLTIFREIQGKYASIELLLKNYF